MGGGAQADPIPRGSRPTGHRAPVAALARWLLWWIPLAICVAPLQLSAGTEDTEPATPALPEAAGEAEPPARLEFVHVVEPGESLERIARRYRVEIDELARDNGIADQNLIRAKTELRVRLAPVPDVAAAPPGFVPAVARRGERPVGEDPPLAPPVDAEALVRRAEAKLRDAYFEEALATADDALARIAARGDGERRARLEMVAGTAELALGNREAALDRFVEALEANPQLRPDPREISPKVLRFLERARTRRAAPATATTE